MSSFWGEKWAKLALKCIDYYYLDPSQFWIDLESVMRWTDGLVGLIGPNRVFPDLAFDKFRQACY